MKKTTSKKEFISSNPKHSDLPKIGQPAQRALAGIGVHRLEQLTRFDEKEVLQLHGMGPKAFVILRQALADRGLSFKDKKGNGS